MRTFNDAFMEAVVNADSTDIRFTIEWQWDDAGAELVYFLSHADSGAPIGATAIHSIHSISSTSQSLNNRYAIAEIGALNFMLADVGDAITAELASRFDSGITPVKKKCTVYMGTKDLDWADYEPVDTWFNDDVGNTGPGYKFRASDVQRLLRQKIFSPDTTRLSASMTASQAHVPVTLALSSTKFQAIVHDANYTFNASTTVGYFKIDDEIIAHDGTLFNHGTDGPSYGVIERGALNTQAAPHTTDESADEDKGKEVTEVIYFEAQVVDAAHLVMAGQNVANTATIPDHWNAGIDTGFIDSDSFTALNTELAGRRYSFIGEEEQDAKEFIEKQCLRFYGLFQTITSQGKLKLQRYERTIEETAPVAYIEGDSLIDIGDLDQRAQDVINLYDIRYNWDYLSERTTRGLKFLDSSSYNANGKLLKSERFEFHGVRTALHSDNDLRNFIYQTRELYSNPPYRTWARVSRQWLGVEVGDVVNLNTTTRKDYVSGSTTLNRPFLVSRRSVDLNTGEVVWEVIGSGLKAEAILDPGAVGSTGELDSAFFEVGTDLESLAEVTSGTVTTDLTLTGTSDINHVDSIWRLDGNLIVPNGVTLTLVNNVQLRVTGEIVVQNGGAIDAKGNGIAGATFGNAATAGYFGTTKAGVGEQQAPTVYWYQNSDFGVIKRLPDPAPLVGQVQTIPFFNLRNEDGTLTGLPGDLRGTPGNPGGANGSPATGDGGNGGNSGAGFISISRGFTIEATGTVDLSGDNGTAGAESDVATPNGTIRFYAGGGGGGCPGGWLCIIDGDFSAPTSDQVTANRGTEINSNPRAHNKTGFTAINMAAAAYRLQYVPARKAIADAGETGARQLGQVAGVAVQSGVDYLIIHNNGSVSERALVTWTALNDADVTGYQMQAKRSADPDWVTQGFTEGDDDDQVYFDVQDGVQYDVRVRALGDGVIPGDWSTTVQHTAVGSSALTAITAPANVAVASGEAYATINSDGTKTERMKVTWDASADPLWTGIEIDYKESSSGTWRPGALINNLSVTEAYLIGVGGVQYDIRLRHLSRTRPNSSYTTVSNHTLQAFAAIAAPTNVTINSGTDQLLRIADGTIIERMKVTWDASADPYWTGTRIVYRPAAGGTYKLAGIITDINVTELFIIEKAAVEYEVLVRHLSVIRPISSNVTVNHTLLGKTAPPSDVTVFSASLTAGQDQITLAWDAVSDIDVSHYEFREGGTDWDTAAFAGYATVPLTSATLSLRPAGDHTFRIKAKDTSGNYSTNAASDDVTVVAPQAPQNLNAVDGFGQGTLYWDAISTDEYDVFEIREGGSDWATATFVAKIRSNRFTITGYEAGVYTFRVKSINKVGTASTESSAEIEIFPAVFANVKWIFREKILPESGYEGLRVPDHRCINSDGNLLLARAIETSSSIPHFLSYKRAGTNFEFLQAFTGSSVTSSHGFFGVTAALSGNGNYVASGNYQETGTFLFEGTAYIFLRGTDQQFSEQTKITNPDPQQGSTFGASIQMNYLGDTVAIGTRHTVSGFDNAGRIYVYARSGTSWSLQATLLDPDGPAEFRDFGNTFVLLDDSGNRLFARATGNPSGTDIYYFERTGTTWDSGTLVPAPDDAEDSFAVTFMTPDGSLAMGIGQNVSAEKSIYILKYNAGSWDFVYKIQKPVGSSTVWGSNKNIYTSNTGRFIMVGDSTNDTCYVYGTSDFKIWTLLQIIAIPDNYTPSAPFFDFYLSKDGRFVVTGDNSDDEAGTNAGAIYVYELSLNSLE